MAKIRVLIVCQWPLGGIRTYLKYNYQHFPRNEFEISILANPAIERDALLADMESIGIKVIWARPVFGWDFLGWRFREIRRQSGFDVVHSQGFFSAVHVSLFNRFRHIPHLMTVHGIVEKKYLDGRFRKVKKFMLEKALRNVDVAIAVSDDIGNDVRNDLPGMEGKGVKWVTIHHGIETSLFAKNFPNVRTVLRTWIGEKPSTFVFGFFGRFMPQKGLEYLIEAANILVRDKPFAKRFVVMAVGSGDYEKRYKADVRQRGLDDRFHFVPFTPNIANWIQGCDAVVMPSVWEAFGLLAVEALCSGVPVIASDCIGLREAVRDTPAICVPANNAPALSEAMHEALNNDALAVPFREFREIALQRFDVHRSAQQLTAIMNGMIKSRKQ